VTEQSILAKPILCATGALVKTFLTNQMIFLITTLILVGCNTSSVKPLPAGNEIGVVLMHGKGGMPGSLSSAAGTLRDAGVIVVTPEMPWSRNRIYSKSYEDSMLEIDQAVEQLREKGAERIFVGGQSMGANAALGYAARRDTLDGLVLFAPGHVPGVPGFAAKVAAGTNKAKSMVGSKKGAERASFVDINQGSRYTVSTTADIYLSWFDPQGPAVMSTNAAKISSNVVIFCADGTAERWPRCQYISNHLDPGIRKEVISVPADHGDVPAKAGAQVVEWLRVQAASGSEVSNLN
jgi:pimeloyl-ACP methyl ester carboxylesterase